MEFVSVGRPAVVETALLFVYLVGAILVWTSDRRQRLGDRVAGTVVAKRGARAAEATPAQRGVV